MGKKKTVPYTFVAYPAIVGLLLVGIVLTLPGCLQKKSQNTRATQATVKEVPKAPLPEGTNVIVLAQKQKGSTVVIDGVRLSSSGFIVVRDDLYGKPGVVIGVSPLLPAGESHTIRLDLQRDFAGIEQLYAELHGDNGDRRFRQVDDPVALDEQSHAVIVPFSLEGSKDPFVDVRY